MYKYIIFAMWLLIYLQLQKRTTGVRFDVRYYILILSILGIMHYDALSSSSESKTVYVY